MSQKDEALREIKEIARRHQLSASEIIAELSPQGDSDSKSSILTRLFAYLGATFVLAGLGVFIEMQWEVMNSIARITVTLGSGVAVFAMALVAARDRRFQIAATPLFVLAALLQPTGILVAIDEFSSGGDERYAFLWAAGALLVQQAFTFVTTRRAVLLFWAIFFGAWLCVTAMDLVGMHEDLVAFTVGISILLVSYSIERTSHRVIAPFWYFVSSTEMLFGTFSLLKDTMAEVLFLAPACGVVFLSTWLKSRTLLVVGTGAILFYIGDYTTEHFADVVGWPIALMLFGLLLLGLSATAFRIDRRYIAVKRS